MTVPSSAVPVDGDGDGDVGVDVVGGGVGCGMWYVVGGNRASHSKPGSVTDEGVLCLVGLCFLPRSSLHHTHTHLRTHNTFTRRRRRHPTRVRDRRAVSISGRVFNNRAINRPAALNSISSQHRIRRACANRERRDADSGWVGRPPTRAGAGSRSQHGEGVRRCQPADAARILGLRQREYQLGSLGELRGGAQDR